MGCLPFPYLGFLYPTAYCEGEKSGEYPDKEDCAPTFPWQDDACDQSSECVADGPRALHDPKRFATVFVRPGFGNEGCSACPFAAHAETEQDAEDRKLNDVLRE